MKDNEKAILYISTFQTYFKKSPYPTYQNLKPSMELKCL